MKLVLFLHAGPDGDRLHRVADALGLSAHTDLGVVHGAGRSGRHEGSRAFPGDGRAMFAVVEDSRAAALMPDIQRIRDTLPEGERLHAFVLPVEQLL
jgi:hypothetical protein